MMPTTVTFISILGGMTGLAFATLSGFEALLIAIAYPIGGVLAVSALIAAILIARRKHEY